MDTSAQSTNQQLDPKLRAAYDRIMGAGSVVDPSLNSAPVTISNPFTSTTIVTPLTPTPNDQNSLSSNKLPSSTPLPPTLTNHTPTLTSTTDAPQTSTPSLETPIPTSLTSPSPIIPTPSTTSNDLNNQSLLPKDDPSLKEKEDKKNPEVHGFVAHRNDKKISPVIIVVAVVAFLIAYTFFWIKVLNVSL